MPEGEWNADHFACRSQSTVQPQTGQRGREERVNSITGQRNNREKTSTQKAPEEYEQVHAKHAAKQQAFERRKRERRNSKTLQKEENGSV